MPYSHKIYREYKTAIVKAAGPIDLQSSIAAMKDLSNDKNFDPHFNVIVDLRKMDFTPTSKDIFGIKDSLTVMKSSYSGEITVLCTDKILPFVKMVTTMTAVYNINMKAATESEMLDTLENREKQI